MIDTPKKFPIPCPDQKLVRFVRLPEILDRIGVTEITLYRWEAEGLFPRRCKIGKHAVAWIEYEINDWCEKRAAGEPWGGAK